MRAFLFATILLLSFGSFAAEPIKIDQPQPQTDQDCK